MTTWFTADLHLGHANIIRYCNRPFANADDMDDELIDGWNAVVADDDTVWVLGDVALGRIDHTLSLVGRLRGRKILLAGNHDRCWAGHGRRAGGWTERYLDAGFGEVRQGEVELDVTGVSALACHFPYRGDSQDQDRYLDYRPVDRGAWLLHGHVHERWRQSGRMINVGVDVWDYQPVPEETIGALMVHPLPAAAIPFPN
ncbi:MAG: metallophosphoesterase [Actinomycetota bacterium]|nr:metallophosphoesterase [Actinomycetota bacterium]